MANKCEICGIECTGKTCSGSCRAKLSRRTDQAHAHAPKQERTRTDTEAHAAERTPEILKAMAEAIRRVNSPDMIDTPEGQVPIVSLPDNYGQEDCTCIYCQQSAGKHVLNHRTYKRSVDMANNEINRVSLPGDPDYAGCMKETAQ